MCWLRQSERWGSRALHARPGDEIQVYDGGLAPKGVFNLTLHNNYTPDGIRTPAFPGAVVSHGSWNGVPEWAYGVSSWFELGMYLPLYSRDEKMGWGIDGAKLRTLFAVPNADDRRFVYGANFEFSYNAKRWDTKRITSEIRPIIGWHLSPVDVIVNPDLRHVVRWARQPRVRAVHAHRVQHVAVVGRGDRGVRRLRVAARIRSRGRPGSPALRRGRSQRPVARRGSRHRLRSQQRDATSSRSS